MGSEMCIRDRIKDGRPLAKELLKKGILIRDCSNYRGLSGGYYRIAVRRREENERLLAALAQVTGSSVVENGKDDKKPAAVPDGIEYVMPQEIEKRSFSIIEEELQLRGITLPVEEAMVTKRVIHTSADFSYAQTMTYSAGAVETAKWLITEGADIVTDTNMALSGIRDMSTLEEPPQDRQPVQTYVLEHDWGVLSDALRRELERGGQAYYLHNRVETIERTAARLQQLLGEDAAVAVAHGKMSQEELNDVMSRMSEGEIDVLVCTLSLIHISEPTRP